MLVSNYAAFEERYNPTGSNNILVLGVYSSHLSNGGDTVDINQVGNRQSGSVAPLNGCVLSDRVDHINYNNAFPWPTAPDGDGPALIRINTADYGNDPINWEASNAGGTPGAPNLVIDTSSPTIPTGLAGQALLSPAAEISLTWSAASDPESYVAGYDIYRNGISIGTSTTTSFVDATIAAGTNYTYTVAAVNRDGYASAQSAAISIAVPSIIASDEPTSTEIEVYFSEPLLATAGAPATLSSNYTVSGTTVSGVALARDNTKVVLTLSPAMTVGSSYTVTIKNLTTVSGDQFPATQTFTFVLQLGTVGVLDPTTPPAPANLHATVTGNNTQITLAWSPVLGLPSGVDHYNIYRNGALYAASTTSSYTDTTNISSKARYSYQVTAVNYDGVEGVKSATVTAVPVGIAAIMTPTTTSVQVQFTEPVDATTAQTAANYAISGVTISGAVLQSDGYTVTLTTSALGTSSHTLTINNVKTKVLSALPALTASFTYATASWAATLYMANVGVGSVAQAETVISTPSEQTSVTSATESVLNFTMQTGSGGHFGNDNPFPGIVIGSSYNNFVVQATGTIQITSAQAGYYTFGVSSDDGFSLSMTGATFSGSSAGTTYSGGTMAEPSPRGPADSLGTTYLAAGNYPVNLVYYQQGGGAELEFYAAPGSYTSFSSSPPWELVGDTADGGLSMGNTYVAPPFTVGVNAESTNNGSPPLTGAITDPAASVTVRVNGSCYAATNNGDGTWSLPQGDISNLGAGTYNVVVTGVNTAGIAAFNASVNQLSIDSTLPTAAITSPTLSPVNSIAIAFSEPVENFTLQDLQLTLANGSAAASEPLEGATLTTTDNQNWTLGNLAGLANASGTYTLTLVGLGSAITDTFGNPLLTGATTTWISGSYPFVQSIDTIGSNVTSASSVQYAVTFDESVTNVRTADFALVANGATGTIASVSGSGSTYTVTVNNVSGIGTLGLNLVDDNSIVDQYNSPLGGPALGDGNFTGQTYTIDPSPVSIAIGGPSASYAAGGPVTYTVTYTNANSITLAAANISLNRSGTANGTVGVTGSGLTRTITIGSITGNGSLGISIAAGTATDQAGILAVAAGPSTTFTVDNTAPSISIGSPSASYAAGGPVTYTVTYADTNFNSSTLAAGNITLNKSGTANGTVSSVSGSGLTYTVTIGGITGNGTLGISIVAGTASDLAGNLAPAAGPSTTFIVDNTAPTISIGNPSASYAANGPITYTVTYADANFNSSTLALGNIALNATGTASGTISSVTGSGLTRTVTISSITGNGSLGISVAAGTASDLAGNVAPAGGPSAVFTVDNIAPTISIGTPSAAYAASGPITYTVTYADTNFNSSTLAAGNITLNETGTASGTISSVTGSGLTRTVTISSIKGDGSLGISIAAGTASDLAGNVAPASGPSSTFIVDNTPPTISISSPSASYAAGGPITYTVTYADANFNNSSRLIGAAIILNATGTAWAGVSVSPGSGLTRTVTVFSISGDGSLGISIAGGTASDLAGNHAPAAGPSATFIVDNTAPTISISSPSASYAAGGPVTYTVTYADTNFNSSTLAAGDITLNTTGTANGTVSVSPGSGLTRTVTVSSITGDGSLGISIAGDTASDLAGNLAPASDPSATFIVDNTAPAISISTPSASYAAGGPITYTVAYADANFNSSTLAVGNITLNTTGTANGTISVSPGSGLTRTVTVSSITGDGSLGISIADGTASDLAGNLAPASDPSATFIVDNTAPTISISTPSAAYAAGGPITYTVAYADANFSSSTLTAGNITLNTTGTANGTISVSPGSGLTRTVTVSSITGDGSLGISIAGGTASDLAGNLAPASDPSATFVVDNTVPTISISTPSAAYVAGGPILYTVTYADANFNSSTLTAGNITLNTTGTANGTISVSPGSGLTRTVTVSSITGDGSLGISIAGGTASDLAGNLAPASDPSATFIVDNTAPTILIGSPSASYAAGGPILYTVTYADANFNSSTLTAGNITLNTTGTANGTISVSSGSGPTRTVTISSIIGDGSLGISIAGGTASDLAGNQAPASDPSATFIVDNSGPTVPTPASATPSPVTGTTAFLSVLGADIATGEPSLTYTWAATALPNGASAPTFSVSAGTNGTNAAKNATATFSAAGPYGFTVTIRDPDGLTATSTVNVAVNQTLMSIALSPPAAIITAGATQQFTCTSNDQFGNPMQPALAWSVIAGYGCVNNGLYTPPYASGSATVQVVSGALAATAGVTVSGQAEWNSPSGGSWNGGGDWMDCITQNVIGAPGVRGIAGDTVLFSSAAVSTVTLNGANPTLAGITFSSSGGDGYTIGQGTGGTLYLDNGGNDASLAVPAGSQTIAAPLALDSSVSIVAAAGSRLAISGPISGVGSSLTLGGGTLVLSGANSYDGGTTVSAGTLILSNSSAIAANTSLTVGAGGTLIFDPSVTASHATTAASNTTTAAASDDTSITTAVPAATNAASATLVVLALTPAPSSPAVGVGGSTVLSTEIVSSRPAPARLAAAERAMPWILWPASNPASAWQRPPADAVMRQIQEWSSAAASDTASYRSPAASPARTAQDAVFGASLGPFARQADSWGALGPRSVVKGEISGKAVDLVLAQPYDQFGRGDADATGD